MSLFDHAPPINSVEAMDKVFQLAEAMTGCLARDECEGWRQWLIDVRRAKGRRAKYSAQEKAKRDEALKEVRAQRAAARAAKQEAQLAKDRERAVRQAEIDERRAFWAALELREPGPRCSLCRGLGHKKHECQFNPVNEGEAKHPKVVTLDLWKRALIGRGQSP